MADPPDAAPGLVPLRVGARHLVVGDDLIVPVDDVNSLSKALVLLDQSSQIRDCYKNKAISRANDFNIEVIYPRYWTAINE